VYVKEMTKINVAIASAIIPGIIGALFLFARGASITPEEASIDGTIRGDIGGFLAKLRHNDYGILAENTPPTDRFDGSWSYTF
jgi:hypothetical protein